MGVTVLTSLCDASLQCIAGKPAPHLKHRVSRAKAWCACSHQQEVRDNLYLFEYCKQGKYQLEVRAKHKQASGLTHMDFYIVDSIWLHFTSLIVPVSFPSL